MVRLPKYREYKERNLGYVRCAEIFGNYNRHYFPGAYDSPESRQGYLDFLASNFPESMRPDTSPRSTVAELCAGYLAHIKNERGAGPYYHHIKGVVRAIRQTVFEGQPVAVLRAARFGPKMLKAVRSTMEAGWTIEADGGKSPRAVCWSRSYINDQIRRLRQMFRWAVGEEIVPASHWQDLKAVPGLRKGRTKAKESPPVVSVSWRVVSRAMRFMPPQLRAMVMLQYLTGMRSQSLCIMRPCDIERKGPAWHYRPPAHKTEHLGKSLTITLGPRCQRILRPFLDRPNDAYLFSPSEAQAWRKEQRRGARKTKVQPSQRNRAKASPQKRAGDRYDTKSYRRAAFYAIRKARTEHWHPHQLRHTCATKIKKRFGTEGSTAFLAHSSIKANEVYAERDLELAVRIALQVA